MKLQEEQELELVIEAHSWGHSGVFQNLLIKLPFQEVALRVTKL